MSFPNLVLFGDRLKRTITDIRLEYVGVNNVTNLPRTLVRSNYNIKREATIQNVSQGTAKRSPDLAYTYARMVHTWTGYADVLTDSVSRSYFATEQAVENMGLIADALIFNSAEGDLTFQLKTFTEAQKGPGNLSNGDFFTSGLEESRGWGYNVLGGTVQYVDKWFIKNITLADNMNNSTRVTFTFEIKEGWTRLKDIVEGL